MISELLDWLMDRMALPDVLFMAAGFCLGVAVMTVWALLDTPGMWGLGIAIPSILFWTAGGVVLFLFAAHMKS